MAPIRRGRDPAASRLVVPGRQPIPIWLTIGIGIGIVAAFIGSFIAGALGCANSNGGIPGSC